MNLEYFKKQLPEIERDILFVFNKLPYMSSIASSIDYEFFDGNMIAATDGKTIFINKELYTKLSNQERAFAIAHELFHIGLKHPSRRGNRDSFRWNLACDLIINHILQNEGFVLPAGVVKGDKFGISNPSMFTAEELYDMLENVGSEFQIDIIGDKETPGNISGDKYREFYYSVHKINWKNVIISYITSFSMKNVMQSYYKLNRKIDYLPGLTRLSTRKLFLVVDTSGSISEKLLGQFLSEVREILKNAVEIQIIYFDATIKSVSRKLTTPIGGGGTEIHDVVDYLNKNMRYGDGVIIFSDGEIYDLKRVDFSTIRRKSSLFVTVGPRPFIVGAKHVKL